MPVHSEGGMQAVTSDLLRGLSEAGHSVDLFTTDRPDQVASVEQEVIQGVRTLYLRTGRPGCYSRAWLRAADSAFRSAHAAAPYDVILSISAATRVLLQRWRRKALRIPSVVVTFGTHVDEVRAALYCVSTD